MSEPETAEEPTIVGQTDDGKVYVVTPGAMAVEDAPSADQEPARPSITDMVEEPAKVMRIGAMVRRLLEEVKDAPLDEASRRRLRDTYARSVEELKSGLAPDLADELQRIMLPFGAEATPTDAELRIAQAQLVGWLEGLFQGIQTALVAQQMAARQQLEQIRRQLPGTTVEKAPAPGRPSRGGAEGMYL